MEEVRVPEGKPIRILEWLVKNEDWIKYGKPVMIYRHIEDPSTGIKTKELQLKSRHVGRVKRLCLEKGQVATPGRTLIELESCTHPVVMKDMCAECGQDLRLLAEGNKDSCARVAMVPNIPELKISSQQAEELGNQDKERLHKMRKLVLLVDLDQTLIHTTQNQAFAALCENNNNFFVYNLHKSEPTLYTKLRPYCREFLRAISQIFELQIVTFGSRQYAHKIAEFIDPEKKYFAHRILSRDECINPMRKSGNLSHLFPCGDSMVCIIDDRNDVWNAAPNVVLVKKYSYFPGAGDINSPDKFDAKKQITDTAVKNDELTQTAKKQVETNSDETKIEKMEQRLPDLCSIKETSLSTDESLPTDDTSADCKEESDVKAETNQFIDTVNELNTSENGTASNPESHPTNNSPEAKPRGSSSINTDGNSVQNNTAGDSAQDNHISNNLNRVNNKTEGNPDVINISKKSETSCAKEIKTSKNNEDSSNIDNKEISKHNPAVTLPDTDDYLLYLENILKEIHKTYYDAYDKFLAKEFGHPPDLRGVLPFIRSKVLYGCHIVLTGIIPSNYKGPVDQHKVHITAKQLGATIDENVSEQTTHLIGGKKGTAKYQDAQKQENIKFVSIDWLMTCSDRWEKVQEGLFPIPKKRSNTSGSNSREGTPPVSKRVKWSSDAGAKTYNPITGKLIKKGLNPALEKGLNPALEEVAAEAARQRDRRIPVEIYSSLEDPKAVVPLKVEIPSVPSTSTLPGSVRTRKPSMAEVMGIEYSLSSNDISEMDKEVDDLLSSEEDEESNDNNNLGTLIDASPSSSSDSSNQNPSFMEDAPTDKQKSDDSSSSSSEEFDHMAELLDHEMHYDEDSRDLDALD